VRCIEWMRRTIREMTARQTRSTREVAVSTHILTYGVSDLILSIWNEAVPHNAYILHTCFIPIGANDIIVQRFATVRHEKQCWAVDSTLAFFILLW
jgi:hypothetical protein